ncbi:MAG: type II toxin-antitoxin system VapC family toxin [Acidobacteria bacterium]|nr:type II toxin-antitoxin system VapC family toxin [Acidobacteriota bacterium]
MERIIVDSDILILVSRDDPTAVLFVENLEKTRGVAISAVSAFELVIGSLNKTDQASIAKFLSRFEHIHIAEDISETALKLLERYRLSHGLLMADALIAATALLNDLEFVTRNTKDFRFIDGLKLVEYP